MECAACSKVFESGGNVSFLRKCGHVMHLGCAQGLSNHSKTEPKRCPACKNIFLDNDLRQLFFSGFADDDKDQKHQETPPGTLSQLTPKIEAINKEILAVKKEINRLLLLTATSEAPATQSA